MYTNNSEDLVSPLVSILNENELVETVPEPQIFKLKRKTFVQ